MLVTDSQFNVSKEKLEVKKISLWSRILLSLNSEVAEESDSTATQLEKGEINRVC